jgi:hypothetical protein
MVAGLLGWHHPTHRLGSLRVNSGSVGPEPPATLESVAEQSEDLTVGPVSAVGLRAMFKQGEKGQRLYLVLDSSVLWNRDCLIRLSVVCGRVLPFLWKVIESPSASVRWQQYRGLLHLAAWVLAESVGKDSGSSSRSRL